MFNLISDIETSTNFSLFIQSLRRSRTFRKNYNSLIIICVVKYWILDRLDSYPVSCMSFEEILLYSIAPNQSNLDTSWLLL